MNDRAIRFVFIILWGVVLGLLLRPQRIQAGGTGTNTILATPHADTYVLAAWPNSNFGSSTALLSQSQPHAITYIRFQIPANIPNTEYVYLNFYNPGNGTNQVQLFASLSNGTGSDSFWDEDGMTYGNRPPLGTLIGVGSVPNEAWVIVNVDDTVRQALGGYVTFALTHGNATPLRLYSREMPGYAPSLVLIRQPTPQECGTICPP